MFRYLVPFLFLFIPNVAQSAESHELQKLINPVMPYGIENSGFCCVSFDISKSGKTKNVDVYVCTDDIMRDNIELAVKRWRYFPKLVNGKKVKQSNIIKKIKMLVTDQYGNPKYDSETYIPKGVDGRIDDWSEIQCEESEN